MKKGQTSVRDGIEDFLCPFIDMLITQGANGSFSHKGTMANDVRGLKAGVKYPYYAPCTVKCVRVTSAANGEATWQSVNKVRFSNGRIDYATFETCHDNTFNAKVGMIVKQGQQLGNMGDRGGATGVHCHIQISQGKSTTFKKNEFGILTFANEYDTDDCYFMDNTNIMNMASANWKYLKDVPVKEEKEWDVGNYEILVPKILRLSPKIIETNKCKVKTIDSYTKTLLTSDKPNNIAKFKIGVVIPIHEIIKEKNGRIWGRYFNTYLVLCNQDGTSQAKRK